MYEAQQGVNSSAVRNELQILWVPTQNLSPHPRRDVIPPLRPFEISELTKNIRENGVRIPLVCTEDRRILDGHNRWEIAKKLQIDSLPVTLCSVPENNQVLQIIDLNIKRRQLSDDQRAIIALSYMGALSKIRMTERAQKANAAKYGTSLENTSISKERSRTLAARQLNVSERKILYAQRINEKEPDRLIDVYNGDKRLLKEYQEFVRDTAPEAPPLPEGKYSVIYADPPWQFSSDAPGSEHSVENHYKTMPLEEIKALPIARLSADDCVLFLWSVPGLLTGACEVMKEWGFEHRDFIVWEKDKLGLGTYTRHTTELLLIGIRGRPGVPKFVPKQSMIAPVEEHSRKPEIFAEIIDKMYPDAKRIELFARGHEEDGKPRAGWTVWGNEAQNGD